MDVAKWMGGGHFMAACCLDSLADMSLDLDIKHTISFQGEYDARWANRYATMFRMESAATQLREHRGRPSLCLDPFHFAVHFLCDWVYSK